MRLIEFIFDIIFNVFNKFLDIMIVGFDKMLSGFDYIVEGFGTITDRMITGIGYFIDTVIPTFCYYILTPILFVIYWCMCKVGPYEMVVLLTLDDWKVLAISAFDANENQYCKIGTRYLLAKQKYWLHSDGTVTEDVKSRFGGDVYAWLPRTNKEKRLFMILSGAKAFIT